MPFRCTHRAKTTGIERSPRQGGGFHASQHFRRASAPDVESGAHRHCGRAATGQARCPQRPDRTIRGYHRHGLGPRRAHGGRGFRRQGAGPADRSHLRRPPEQARHRRQHRASVDRDPGRQSHPRRSQLGRWACRARGDAHARRRRHQHRRGLIGSHRKISVRRMACTGASTPTASRRRSARRW